MGWGVLCTALSDAPGDSLLSQSCRFYSGFSASAQATVLWGWTIFALEDSCALESKLLLPLDVSRFAPDSKNHRLRRERWRGGGTFFEKPETYQTVLDIKQIPTYQL